MQETLKIIRSKSELQELREYISNNDYLAFDTETTGVIKNSKIIGFSVSADTNLAYYVILRYWDVETSTLVDLDTVDEAHSILKLLEGKNLIMQNGVFDCYMVESNYNIRLIDYLHTDTMILAHLLNENRHCGLKELGVAYYGEDAKAEQTAMKESVHARGGKLTKECYELYKADPELLAKYGAKDAILTIKLFYTLVEELYAEGLEDFFYKDESMPLLRGPTYELNTSGLKIDMQNLEKMKGEIEANCLQLKALIDREVFPHVQSKYPGTKKTNVFNINSSQQLSWLLYGVLNEPFGLLTAGGKELCKAMGMKIPYDNAAKRDFIHFIKSNEGVEYHPPTGKVKKIKSPWAYVCADAETLGKYSKKYIWLEKFLELRSETKILSTYIEGVREKVEYGAIRPSFLQHGTTSGRYSSRNPNFQNLPRSDKRVKSLVIPRPGKVFVGADYSQLEPRVFASFSKDTRLMSSFQTGDDFYSVVGQEVFDKYDCTLKKSDPDSFAVKYPNLRDLSKVFVLSSTYGTTSHKLAPKMKKSVEEAQDIIDTFFERFPDVKKFMLESHEQVKKEGYVTNLFGRKRRIPKAIGITQLYGKTKHADLPYEIRTLLNLAVNHRIQSTGASIMNRAAIAFYKAKLNKVVEDKSWKEVKIVMQVHDELIIESPSSLGKQVSDMLKHAMETTTVLPGVVLVAEPKIATNLADLK